MPEWTDYPEQLTPYLYRDVRAMGMETAMDLPRPFFLKPRRPKEFAAAVVDDRPEWGYMLCRHREDTPVWVSPVVEFQTEWRVYVLRGDVVGWAPYKGDPLIVPTVYAVRDTVRAFAPAPAAYVLDVGVARGWTTLVEVNEGYAFGAYGLREWHHAEMLAARWAEIVDYAMARRAA